MGEQLGFEERDAVEAPSGVGDLVDELSLGGVGGDVLIEKLLDMAQVGFGVLRGQDSGVGSEAVAEGVLRRTLFARLGARPVECAKLARLTAGSSSAALARLASPVFSGWGWLHELLRASRRT